MSRAPRAKEEKGLKYIKYYKYDYEGLNFIMKDKKGKDIDIIHLGTGVGGIAMFDPFTIIVQPRPERMEQGK